MSDPRLLAAGAAGFASAAAALWAFRGLPLGTALFWLSSFPLFAAGLGFGAGAAAGAVAVAAALLALVGGPVAAVAFLVLFGVPAALLLAAGLRGRGRRWRRDVPAGPALGAARALAGRGAAEPRRCSSAAARGCRRPCARRWKPRWAAPASRCRSRCSASSCG